MSKKYRVIQWGMGLCGTPAVRMMLRKKSIEMVGVIVNRPEKAGRDVGELAGEEAVGILASNDIGKVLGRDADVVIHMTSSSMMEMGTWDKNKDEILLALNARKNVITTTGFLYPWRSYPDMCRELDETAKRNGVTLLGTGAAPGFHPDLLPLLLTGSVARVDHILIKQWEDDTPVTAAWLHYLGYGKDPGEIGDEGTNKIKQALIHFYSESIHFLADALGWDITEIRTQSEYFTAKETLQIAQGEIRPGTICAQKLIIDALRGEKAVITIEQVFKVCPDKVKEPEGTNSIWIDSRPTVGLELTGNWWHWVGPITGFHAVNCIPQVVAAAPGFVSHRDLPLSAAIG
ncbi:MAG: hypothetical protein JW950_06565 [Deltaproteobacteria bacterium]|nr:hypothetical protein [Deltaproteobacteria bacterium]